MGRNLYFIHGPEEYLATEIINRIVTEVNENANEEAEYVSYYGDELSPERLAEVLDYSPLFASSRVVVIKRVPWMVAGKKRSRAPAEYMQVLEQYLKNPVEEQTVVITAREFQSQNDLAKLMLKNAETIACEPLNKEQRIKWLQEEIKKRQKSINKDALTVLAGSVNDLYHLKQIVDKMCLLVSSGTITKHDLQEERLQKENVQVFKLLDAILSRNLESSMQVYRQMIQQGEHQIRLLYWLVRQFNALGIVKALQEQGYDRQKIAALTGQKDFAVRSLEGKTKLFTWGQIRNLNQLFLQTDLSFKSTGQDPNLLMECLIIETCQGLS